MTHEEQKARHEEYAMKLLPHVTAINEILKDCGIGKYVDVWYGGDDYVVVDGSGLGGWKYVLNGDKYYLRHESSELLIGGDGE